MRDVAEVRHLAADSVDVYELDLADTAALPGRVADILARPGRLDALINNAGVAPFETLRPVAARVGVGVSIVEPGPVRTSLCAGIDMAQRLAAAGPYRSVLEAFLATARDAERSPFRSAQSPGEVAALIADVLEDPQPKLRYQTSPRACCLIRPKLADLDGRRYDPMMDTWLGAGD